MPAKGLSYYQIAIVEPLAKGAHAIQRAQLQKGEVIVVVGCGPIGIGIVKLVQIADAVVIDLDVNDDRLVYPRKKVGADYVINVSQDPATKIREITNGSMVHVVLKPQVTKQPWKRVRYIWRLAGVIFWLVYQKLPSLFYTLRYIGRKLRFLAVEMLKPKISNM